MISLGEKDTLDYAVNYASSLNDNVLNNVILYDIDKNIILIKDNGAGKVFCAVESDLTWDKNYSLVVGIDKKGVKTAPLGKKQIEGNEQYFINLFE